jgi:hypothetical protein
MEKFDISKFSPCKEGVDYYKKYTSFEEAWNACKRGDWMLWIAFRLEIGDRLLTKAKALCASCASPLMRDKRSTEAIDAAFRYAAGEISREELNKYAAAAYAAAAYAAAAYAVAIAYAATSAYAAAYAYAADAADAADAAGAAAYATICAAASIAEKIERMQQTADICREVLTDAVFEKIKLKIS